MSTSASPNPQQIILVGHGTLKADTKKCTDKLIEMGQKHKRQSAFDCSNILVLQSFDLRTWKEVDRLTRLGLSESKLTSSFFAGSVFKKAGSREVSFCTLEQRHRGDEAGLDGVEGVLHRLHVLGHLVQRGDHPGDHGGGGGEEESEGPHLGPPPPGSSPPAGQLLHPPTVTLHS